MAFRVGAPQTGTRSSLSEVWQKAATACQFPAFHLGYAEYVSYVAVLFALLYFLGYLVFRSAFCYDFLCDHWQEESL